MENTELQPVEIDYSTNIAPAVAPDDGWESPPRKYFGPKNAVTGKMEREPVQKFIPYPSMRYAQPDGPGTKIVTKLVMSAEEDEALKKGAVKWSSTAATFGHIGAPSFEENLRLQQSAGQRAIDEAMAKQNNTLHLKK